jgi:hypothetical protein
MVIGRFSRQSRKIAAQPEFAVTRHHILVRDGEQVM